MKITTIYLTIILILGVMFVSKAQDYNKTKNGFEGFIEVAFDLKMATQGPYKGKPQDIGKTLNFEITSGFEYEKARFGFKYEMHDAIQYWKTAFFYDRIQRDKLIGFINAENFSSTYGFELGMIRRYFEKDPDWIQYGFNFGTAYRIHLNGNDTGFSITANYNVFRGETAYRKYKSGYFNGFRHDVMFGIKRNF